MMKMFSKTICFLIILALVQLVPDFLKATPTGANDRKYIGLGKSTALKDFSKAYKDAKTVHEFIQKGQKYANDAEFNYKSGKPIPLYPSSNQFTNEIETKFDSILAALNKIEAAPATSESNNPSDLSHPDPEVRFRAITRVANYLSVLQLQYDERSEMPQRLEIIIDLFGSTQDALREIAVTIKPLASFDPVIVTLGPYFGPFEVWFDLDQRLIPKTAAIISVAKTKRQTLIPYLENRRLEINNLSNNLRELIRRERARLHDAESALANSMRLLEESAGRLNDQRTTIERLRGEIKALKLHKIDLERSIRVVATNLGREQANNDQLNTELKTLNSSLSTPFEQSGFRCPAGNVWDSCTHSDLKNGYRRWQEDLMRNKRVLEQRIGNSARQISLLNQRRSAFSNEGDITEAQITSKSKELDQRQATYERDAYKIIDEFRKLATDRDKNQTQRLLNSYYDMETQIGSIN